MYFYYATYLTKCTGEDYIGGAVGSRLVDCLCAHYFAEQREGGRES